MYKPYLQSSFLSSLSMLAYVTYSLLLLTAPPAHGEIQFKDVTRTSGINHSEISFGASWGDFNGDGWPDIWIGNHHHNAPSLYLNQGDGKFVDIAPKVWTGNTKADTHGAAWADFDNDGDQDLIELAGASYGAGEGPNHLFVNDNGMFSERAFELGVAYPLGRGRTPQWLDANSDGKLDLLVVNVPRRDKTAPTALFLQKKNGFHIAASKYGLPQNEPSKLKHFYLRASRFIARFLGNKEAVRDYSERLTGSAASLSKCFSNSAFATLTDINPADGNLLVVCTDPLRFYSTNPPSFKDLSGTITLPRTTAIQDAIFGDFNGDGNTDIYLVRSKHWESQLVLTSPSELHGYLAGGDRKTKEVRFKSRGELVVRLYGDFTRTQIQLGNDASSPNFKEPQLTRGMEFSLNPRDTEVVDLVDSSASEKNTIWIGYYTPQNTWILRSTVKSVRLEIITTESISSLKTSGFQSTTGAREDKLLLQAKTGFIEHPLPKQNDTGACHSAVTGDFDNDMDLDIYLVCSAPSINLPNILYENTGNGKFTEVTLAGGAQASDLGRGDSVTLTDFNQDGFLDLFITNGRGEYEGPLQLFQNKGNQNHWIEIDLKGNISNRDGIGAVLELKAAGSIQRRIQSGGMHRYSQNHQRIHFGLGQNSMADYIKVEWPSGIIQTIENIKADQILKITEPLK